MFSRSHHLRVDNSQQTPEHEYMYDNVNIAVNKVTLWMLCFNFTAFKTQHNVKTTRYVIESATILRQCLNSPLNDAFVINKGSF